MCQEFAYCAKSIDKGNACETYLTYLSCEVCESCQTNAYFAYCEVIAHCLIVKYADLHIFGEIIQFACLWNVRHVTMGWGYRVLWWCGACYLNTGCRGSLVWYDEELGEMLLCRLLYFLVTP